MPEKKYVVPEGMLRLVNLEVGKELLRDTGSVRIAQAATQAAIEWLAENPIVPDDKQIGEMITAKRQFIGRFEVADWIRWGATEWRRRMFLAPEPEVPEAVKDLMVTMGSLETRPPQTMEAAIVELNERTMEAYRRGLKNGAKYG